MNMNTWLAVFEVLYYTNKNAAASDKVKNLSCIIGWGWLTYFIFMCFLLILITYQKQKIKCPYPTTCSQLHTKNEVELYMV